MTLFEKADAKLLPDFKRRFVEVNGNRILTLAAGKGPPLLMLHGDPETHLCWHHIAPKLTDRFTVILTDIRGRGESHKPPHDFGKNAYTKRDMAAEQFSVMQMLGYDKFAIVAHDRGARIARRLALDRPESVTQLVVMDIIPALDFYSVLNAEIAQDYFYFSFLTQDFPIPDQMIAGDPAAFLRQILFGLSDKVVDFEQIALSAYMAANTTPEAITAMCECFRAGYHIDQLHDADDRKAGRKIVCPTLVLWGEQGIIGKHFEVQRIWEAWCERPEFASMPSGHFIPEEAHREAIVALNRFLLPPQ